jgi:hypothetical protein
LSTETMKAIAAAGDSATSPMTTATYTIMESWLHKI